MRGSGSEFVRRLGGEWGLMGDQDTGLGVRGIVRPRSFLDRRARDKT